MKALSRTLLAVACTAALGACSTMDHMMHSSGSIS